MKVIKLFLASILLSFFMVHSALAQAPEGTVLASWDSTINGVGLGFDGQYLYIPDGIDATQLEIFDTAGTPQGVLALTCNIGNLSYDSTRNVFWAGQASGASAPIYTIDPATGVCTYEFDAWPAMAANGDCGTGCTWPFDGIDFDERDDTLRISLDGSTIIYNLNLDGTFNSSFGPIDTTVPCGFDFSSGIATGQSEILYSATNGCTEVFKWDKDTGAKLDHFTLTAARNEAMECDNVTFAGGGNDAIWVKDLEGPIQAFAVPEDTCEIIPEPTIEKFYTHTNNNWSDRCVETNPDTGLCVVYRLPNVNVDSDIFAAELPKVKGTFLLYGEAIGKKTVVTPGQYIAVSVVDVPLEQDIWVVEDFSNCTDLGSVKPNKVPGGVQVVLVDANGDVHDIDDDLADGIGGSIILGDGSATVHVEGVPAGSQLRVLVKFQPSRQAVTGMECINVEQLVDEAGGIMSEAAAGLKIVPLSDKDGDGIPNDVDACPLEGPADPALGEILEPNGCIRQSQCSDGIDNDGDTFIDFPTDAGCDDILDDIEEGDCLEAFDCSDPNSELIECGNGGDCACFQNVDGPSVCIDSTTPCAGLTVCVDGNDCGFDEACVPASCCGEQVCVNASICNDPAAKAVNFSFEGQGPTLGRQ